MNSKVAENLAAIGELLKTRGFKNVAVTPESHRRVNARSENACAIDLAGVLGWSRPFDKAVLPTELFELLKSAHAVYQDGPWWRCRYRFSTLDGYGFFHSAFPADTKDAVFFGPDTYRFIAALQVELANTKHSWMRAADIGTGSGAAGICLARQNPNATVVLADANENAISLSKINARLAGAGNVTFHIGSDLDGLEGNFDLIVANAPYLLGARKRKYRHGGHERGEGLSLEIFQNALSRLVPDGRLFLYAGSAIVDGVDYFFQEIKKRLAESTSRWSYREIDPDVFGEELDALEADRIAAVFLCLTK